MRYGEDFLILARTGVAACNVEGITIHSYAGIGTGSGTREELLRVCSRLLIRVHHFTS
jgi:ATP-dependent DNA helicase PIF1